MPIVDELESTRLSLDYAQRQTSQAQVEITRLRVELANARELLRKANVSLLAFEATCDSWTPHHLEELIDAIKVELAKE